MLGLKKRTALSVQALDEPAWPSSAPRSFAFNRVGLKTGRLSLAAALAFAALLLGAAPALALSQERTLTIHLEKKPDWLVPSRALAVESHFILAQVFQRLVRANPDGTITGELATSWHALKDGPGYEFELKEDARFSDGSPVTSSEVAEMLRQAIRGGFARGLELIDGAAEYHQGRSAAVRGIEILGPHRLQLHLTRFDSRFLITLWILKCSVTKAASSPGEIPLGSGPYRVASFQPATGRVELRRNGYSAVAAEFDHIMASPEEGRYDISMTMPTFGALAYQERKYFAVETYFLGLNSASPRLSQRGERQRLATLLTSELVEPIFPQLPYRVGSYIPLGVFGYSPDTATALSTWSQEVAKSAESRQPVTLTTYHPKLRPLAYAYCQKLTAAGTPCRVVERTTDQILAAKKDNSLELFLLRIRPAIVNTESCLAIFTAGDPFNWVTDGAGDQLGRRMEASFQALLLTPVEQKRQLLEQYQAFDRLLQTEALVKPFAYGGERSIWYRRGLALPVVDSMGISEMKLTEVKLSDGLQP